LNELGFDLLLPLLNWTGMFLDKNIKYIPVVNTTIKLLRKIELPIDTSIEIVSVTLEMLDRVLLTIDGREAEIKNDPILKYYV
jgi:hypothetical protein